MGVRFRSYIDTQLTGSRKVSRLTERPTTAGIEGDYDPIANIAMKQSALPELRPFPGRAL